MPQLMAALRRAPYVAIDTEFPGFIVQTPRQASGHRRYADLRLNGQRLKIVQLAFSFFVPGCERRQTWQINFRDFDAASPSDERWDESVEMLRGEGVDFERMRRDGVDSALLSSHLQPFFLLFSGWRPKPLWVTFHGAYDVADLAKLLIAPEPLPPTLLEFTRLLANILGRVVDVKHLARHVGGAHLGLRRLAETLAVANSLATSAHQADSQSLLAGKIYDVLVPCVPPARLLSGGQDSDVGVLHGLEEERIVVANPLPPTWRPTHPPPTWHPRHPPPTWQQWQGFLPLNIPTPTFRGQYFIRQCGADPRAFFYFDQHFAPPR
ncbi:putative CCR4-associated factor 1 homolog 8 [Wolffia australiana]